ncbi:hypothetical protein BCD49_32660 [Pseudofrankia sp. EUN1h]|nr:hypothetical protein BCD49_32660 [Pseudofrankia sp. EUN1h]
MSIRLTASSRLEAQSARSATVLAAEVTGKPMIVTMSASRRFPRWGVVPGVGRSEPRPRSIT